MVRIITLTFWDQIQIRDYRPSDPAAQGDPDRRNNFRNPTHFFADDEDLNPVVV